MKKILFIAARALLSITADAQSVVNVEGGKYPVYCEVMGYNTWGFGKVKARLDMGRSQPNKDDYEYIYDGGKKRKFNTMMEIIDYMAKRGWSVHSTYVVSEGIGKQNVLHFLLVKYVSSDSEIDDGLELSTKE